MIAARTHVESLALALFACAASACARHGPSDRAADLRDAAAPAVVAAAAGSDGASHGDAASDGDAASHGDAASDGDAVSNASGDAEHTALGGYPAQLELREGNETLGFVSVPLGAREPRPLMIAIHGGSDRPQRACAAWRDVTEAYPFVVCPRGFGGNEARLGWRSTADTAARIARAVAAARKVFGAWIKETPSVVLAGFSMGGSQVARLAAGDPRTYRRIVVGDSAHEPRPALTFSRAWAAGGGARVIFLCTTSGCEPSFRKAARNAAARAAPARLNIAATQVHGLSAPVVQSMRRDWPWLVEGAEGWQTYAPPSTASLPGKTERFEPN